MYVSRFKTVFGPFQLPQICYFETNNVDKNNVDRLYFIDRVEETQRLDVALQGSRSFVVIWGRRRVGKSRMLIEWVNRNDGLYIVADQSAVPVQRRYFATALGTRFIGFEETEYPDWHALFRRLDREVARIDWKGPLIIDEFLYLTLAEPEILAVMQNWIVLRFDISLIPNRT